MELAKEERKYLKQLMCAPLLSAKPKSTKILPKLNDLKHQSHILNSLPTVVSDDNTFYRIISCQKSIKVYRILPSIEFYQFYFEKSPIDLHIISGVIYMLLNRNTLYVSDLDVQEQQILQIPKLQGVTNIYSMYTGRGSENQKILKIGYWKNGFGIYEHGVSSFKFSIPFVGYLQTPFQSFTVIQPDILGYVITRQKHLRFINLNNQRLFGEHIVLKSNPQKLKISFISRGQNIFQQRNGYCHLLLSLTELDSKQVQLYRISIQLRQQFRNRPYHLDEFINTNIGQELVVSKLVVLHLTGTIVDSILTSKGLIITRKDSPLSFVIKSDLYYYNKIDQKCQIDNLQIWMLKYSVEDFKFKNNDQKLRNRVIMPDRFPLELLQKVLSRNNPNQLISSQLLSMKSDKLLQLLKRLKFEWNLQYEFHSYFEYKNNLYVIRNNSISVITSLEYQINSFYYQNYVKNLYSEQEAIQQNQSESVISSFTESASKSAKTSLNSIDDYQNFYPQILLRISNNPIQSLLYKQCMVQLQQLKSNALNEIYQSSQNNIILNALLSNVRFFFRVTAEVLVKCYRSTIKDFGYDDSSIIQIICNLHQAINTPLKILLHFQKQKKLNVNCDILQIIIPQNIRYFKLVDIDDKGDLAAAITVMLKDLFSTTTEKTSKDFFQRNNIFLSFLLKTVSSTSKLTELSQKFISCENIELSIDILKLCLACNKLELFRKKCIRILMEGIVSCKKLLKYFENSEEYQTGRAILQYLSLGINEQGSYCHDLLKKIDKNNQEIVKNLFNTPESLEIQIQIAQKLECLSYIMNDYEAKKTFCIIKQKILKNDSYVNQLIKYYAIYDIADFVVKIQKNILVFQIEIYNKLKIRQYTVNNQDILQLLSDMLHRMKKIAQKSYQNKDQILFQDLQKKINNKTPTRRYVRILIQSQAIYKADKIIPCDEIPYCIIQSYMQTKNNELVLDLAYFYTDKTVAQALFHYTNSITDNSIKLQYNYSLLNYMKFKKVLDKKTLEEFWNLMKNNKVYRCAERETALWCQ